LQKLQNLTVGDAPGVGFFQVSKPAKLPKPELASGLEFWILGGFETQKNPKPQIMEFVGFETFQNLPKT